MKPWIETALANLKSELEAATAERTAAQAQHDESRQRLTDAHLREDQLAELLDRFTAFANGTLPEVPL